MPNTIALTSLVGKTHTCRNGLRHGATAKTLFLPGENVEDFFALLHQLFEFYRPNVKPDAVLVTELVLARWFFLRRQSAYLAHKSELFRQKPDCREWSSGDRHQLELLRSYKNQSERIIRRTLDKLERDRVGTTGGGGWRYHFEARKKRFELETW